MKFEEWWDKVYNFKSMDPEDSARAAWDAALEEAAKICDFMNDATEADGYTLWSAADEIRRRKS